jgi:hypothetical protein
VSARIRYTLVLTVLGFALLTGRAVNAQGLDSPTAVSWPATHAWSSAYENAFSQFVAAIGQAVAEGRCGHLDACLRDPRINPLWERGAERFHFRADCADVPYVLRAYFAYKNQLPFAFARRMHGRGRDARYLVASHPDGTRLWSSYSTPRHLLEGIGSDVHSGYLRTAPDVEDSDFYPAAINRAGIRPGTVFYDPNGHVLVVWAVHDDGDVMFFDGHPDNSMSHPRFTQRQILGSARLGGGFKNWRPIAVRDGVLAQARNHDITLYGADAQYDRAQYLVQGQQVAFDEWVRGRLDTRTSLTADLAGTPVRIARNEPRRNYARTGWLATNVAAALRITHRRRRDPGAAAMR